MAKCFLKSCSGIAQAMRAELARAPSVVVADWLWNTLLLPKTRDADKVVLERGTLLLRVIYEAPERLVNQWHHCRAFWTASC